MSDLPPALTDAIRDRYVVERGIGAGGMATVHLARDVRHHRRVAIKVLKPELTASLGAERFLKEIEIAARLTHPHIVPLHDSGQAAGFLYYVMPFIDGESLRARLDRETRLDQAAALEIVRPVGGALSYAHHQGVLHRDIKPENILFSAGHPMVADFGIARAVNTAGGANITQTGMALGTPGYMSPEQAAGERDLDARTDVYSLGCVLYEMLVGAPPGRWQRVESVQLGRLTDLPAGHRAHLEPVGEAVERVLVRALAMRLEDRYPTMDDFLDALNAERGAGEARGAVRRYRDHEVEAIVRHAAEEQLAHPTDGGMSLESVQQIAEDVGISPERVERAARALEARASSPPPAESGPAATWLGSPTVIEWERVVEGEVTEAVYDDIVDEIQAALSAEGQVDTLGRSLMWRTRNPSLGKARAVQVRVTPRGGQTRIHIQERLGELAWTTFPTAWGIGAGGLAVLLSVGGPEWGWALAGVLSGGWVGGMYAAARRIFRGVAQRKRADLGDLGERIGEIVADSAQPRRIGERTETETTHQPPMREGEP